MKKTILILIFIVCSNKYIYSQQNMSPNKEYYDHIENVLYSNFNFDTPAKVCNIGGWIMESYLNLYETTKDKAYLIKFINFSAFAMNKRRDAIASLVSQQNKLFPNDIYPPKWTLESDNPESLYFNTLVTYPMAKFIYLVRSDNDLYEEPINTNCIHISDLNSAYDLYSAPYSAPTFLTFGDYTNWLGKRIEETLWYLNEYYWDDNLGHVKHYGDDVAAELNFQSLFATLYLYMYRIHTQTNLPNGFGYYALSTSYMYNKLDKLADLYQGTFLCNNSNTSVNVFCDINEGAYAWGHWGWKNIDCDDYLYEDVSHGAMDAIFPMADYYTGQDFFPTSFYEKFHDTFTKNIYVSESRFYNTVWGTDDGMTEGGVINQCDHITTILGNSTSNFFWAEILNWMPLQEWDSPGNTIYDPLLLHVYKLKNLTFTAYADYPCRLTNDLGGQSFLGLSQVVKAQWEWECVNLTLYNRDVVYDQKFFAKNNLTISPQENSPSELPNYNYYTVGDDPFTEPKTFTDTGPIDRFVIETEKTVYMSAGNEIVLKPGFIAKAGCEFHASIDPNLCGEGRMHSSPNYNTTENNTTSNIKLIKDSLYLKDSVNIFAQNKDAIVANSESSDLTLAADIESLGEQKIQVYPNPTKDNLTIKITPFDNNSSAMVAVYDLQSHLLLNKAVINEITVVEISDLPKGSYIIKVSINLSSG